MQPRIHRALTIILAGITAAGALDAARAQEKRRADRPEPRERRAEPQDPRERRAEPPDARARRIEPQERGRTVAPQDPRARRIVRPDPRERRVITDPRQIEKRRVVERRTTAVRTVPSHYYRGYGTIRYGERFSPTRRTVYEKRPGPIVYGGRHIDVHVRSVPSWGRRVYALPPGHRTVVFAGREYYSADSVFYAALNIGPRVEYVVTRPPIGVTVEYLPAGYEVVYYEDRPYFHYEDVYYEPVFEQEQVAYRVVEPPFGAFIADLPEQYEVVAIDGRTYYHVGGFYYRPCFYGPDLVYRRVEIEIDFDD